MSYKFGEIFKKVASEKKTHLSERKLLKNIRKGFENQEFKMYLQFIVDSKEGKISSAETLSRWVNSSGEVIFPGTYIGIMEKSGLIARFDYYMFEKVCKKLSEWKDSELSDVSLSCNLTRITISEKDFAEKIEEISNKYDFDKSKLVIEITEDSIEKNLVVAMFNIIKIKKLG
ncbi:MAG: EAL domain-containing protein, partial [Acutalibacteraceae bacterium]|nr:EAL domain-containing protein [Acutalibacteraceae bacterium]